jgi:hypothetical protein
MGSAMAHLIQFKVICDNQDEATYDLCITGDLGKRVRYFQRAIR